MLYKYRECLWKRVLLLIIFFFIHYSRLRTYGLRYVSPSNYNYRINMLNFWQMNFSVNFFFLFSKDTLVDIVSRPTSNAQVCFVTFIKQKRKKADEIFFSLRRVLTTQNARIVRVIYFFFFNGRNSFMCNNNFSM